jgi:hypothetical protein
MRVIVIGFDPDAVADFGIDPDEAKAAISSADAAFLSKNIEFDNCLIDLNLQDGLDRIEKMLRECSYDCAVVGGGIRKPEPLLEYFESVVNLIRSVSPSTYLAFNTNAADSCNAALRSLRKV